MNHITIYFWNDKENKTNDEPMRLPFKNAQKMLEFKRLVRILAEMINKD
jgi:hypothetical protein